MKRTITTATAALLFALTACGSGGDYEDLVERCGLTDNPHVTIDEGGQTLTFTLDVKDRGRGVGVKDAKCLNKPQEVPDSVEAKIMETSTIDGMQSASWGNTKLEWAYDGSEKTLLLIYSAL